MTHFFPTLRYSDLELGHREIGLLTMRLGRDWPHGGPEPAVADPERLQTPHFHVQGERIRGVYDAMSAAGLDPESLTVVESYEHLRSEEHTSELQSLMRISYAVFCLKKKIKT